MLEITSRLLKLAKIYDESKEKDSNKEMRLAISRCIGEIGPVDFQSLALPATEGKSFVVIRGIVLSFFVIINFRLI